jgi:hypothetical protein
MGSNPTSHATLHISKKFRNKILALKIPEA